MNQGLNIRIFAHSWVSDWNHGNAHFLRGLARILVRAGSNVRCYEQLGSWSLSNLVRHEGERAIDAIDHFRKIFPELDIRFYNLDHTLSAFLLRELRGADVVLVHEWSDPVLVNAILALKQQLGFYVLLHDTHHRALSDPRELLRFHLHLFDGVLAFGEPIARIYRDGFGMERVWTLHEAADIENFKPLPAEKTHDLLWIGNWGDEERTRELSEFLIQPAMELNGRTKVHGVRYPEEAKQALADAGIEFAGYLPNLRAPEAYAASALTVHIPRRHYANGLSGIPTIRVFEALACGTPLVCAPWEDAEGLFRPGEDYLVARDGAHMAALLRELLADEGARRQMAANGLETLRRRHTCEHRAEQLLGICAELAEEVAA
ncbi:MAG: glycosyltransferase [Candidatus Koribacter versatilis]|uniref:Glycosyltransferase n=1 Tax=Candidatus Korobacter versatilis TaxID=658062 RepID=A0A932EQ76_9BACT|nr:glycosyltransferase [Candidatus Koribacter versatilis]